MQLHPASGNLRQHAGEQHAEYRFPFADKVVTMRGEWGEVQSLAIADGVRALSGCSKEVTG